MSFYTDFCSTVENCAGTAAPVAGVSYVQALWTEANPSFPPGEFDGTSYVTFQSEAAEIAAGARGADGLYEAAASSFQADGSAAPIGGGVSQPLDPTVNQAPGAFVDSFTLLPEGPLQTFFSAGGPATEYSPDWVDFGITLDGVTASDSVVTAEISQNTSTLTPANPLTVQFIEDSAGEWRVRVTGLEDVDAGDSVDGTTFNISDWPTTGPLNVGTRWAGVEVSFTVNGGTPVVFFLVFQWRFASL